MAADIVHTEPGATMPQHKPEYSDMCNICGPAVKARKDKARALPLLFKSLRAFGYTTLTMEEASTSYDSAIANTMEGDIIAMLMRRQLVEAGIIVEADGA